MNVLPNSNVPNYQGQENRSRAFNSGPSLWSFMFGVGLASCVLGGVAQSISTMALGMTLSGLGYAISDVVDTRVDSVTPLTIHAIFSGVWMGVSHLIAGFVMDTRYEHTFFAFSAYDFLLEAQYLAMLMAVVPLIAGRLMDANRRANPHAKSSIPPLGPAFSDRLFLAAVGVLVLADVVGVLFASSLAGLPVIGPVLRLGSLGAIFMLAWHWYGPRPSIPGWTKYLILVLIVVRMGVAFLYNDMRGEMVYPVYAFYLAVLLRRAMRRWMVVAALIFLLPFSYVYSIIGGIKGQGIVGSERVTLVLGQQTRESQESDEGNMLADAAMTLAARACNFAQLSQVVSVTEEDGLYYGETISYLLYVFIPRAIWPDKPEVQPGQWFAKRLGKGSQITETRFSNSINMTIAGELYLNFGWAGAVIGLFAYGLLLWQFWQTVRIFDLRNNVIGLAFAFLLLTQGSYASSAAAIPQIVIGYASMKIAQVFFEWLGTKRGIDAPVAVPRGTEGF